MAQPGRGTGVRTRVIAVLLLALPVIGARWARSQEGAPAPAASIAAPGEREAVLDFYHRFREAPPDVERSMWSEDARWLNAFGRVFVGRDAIVEWTIHLNAQPGYAASHVSKQDDPEIRFLRPDVAIIHEYHEREGQIIDGVVTPTRRINSTYVLTRENGTWLIRDKVTMDERERSKTAPSSPPGKSQ